MVQNHPPQQGAKKPASPSEPKTLWDIPEVDMKIPWPAAPRLSSSHTHASQPPLPLPQAFKELKESCDVYTQGYAMLYVDLRGHVNCQVSTSLGLRTQDIFSKELCQKLLGIIKHENGADSLQSPPDDTRKSTTKDRRRHSDAYLQDDGHLRTGTERPKRNGSKCDPASSKRRMTAPEINSHDPAYGCLASGDEDGETSDSDAFEGAGIKYQTIKISDGAALEKFYTTRFIQMQQIPCKVINKAWVKIVQPRKQAHNPYNGGKVASSAGQAGCGHLTKPDWWPREGCRHREPDHIQKNERLVLLVHILRNLYYYNGKDGKRVTVAELQQSTKECFPDNQQYRQVNEWLKEIYYIRREEERYLEGEIDGDAIVSMEMPNKEPRLTTKKTRAKARAKRRAIRTPSRSNTASTTTPSASLQSPTAVASPVSHLDIRKLKQEPATDCNRYVFQADNQCSYPEQELGLRQREVSNSVNTSFSADNDYSTPQLSSLPATVSSAYLPAQNSPEALNLGFGPMAVNTFGAIESFHAKQRQRDPEAFLQNPSQSNDWIPPSLGPQCQTVHPSWGFTPMVNEQQAVLQSSLQFPGSRTGTVQSVSASSQLLPQMTPATPYITGARSFSQDLEFMSTHPQGGLPDFQNMQITDRSYHGLQ